MLGFQTDWNIECSVFVWTLIGVFLGLGFIVKQRSGFGFDYMSLAQREEISRGHLNNTILSS